MNDTIKAKKKLEKGHIKIDQFIGQAIYWACKSNHKNLRKIFENKPAEEIAALEKSISESLSRDSDSD
jgi:hypothetical protein